MADPVKIEPITQENLPAALEQGRITQAEVEDIWAQTSFLSAQTPIEFRRAVIAIGGDKLDSLQTLVLSQLMDIRAAMTKEESKFAHLVAGTETIVKTLQNVNPLVRRLERQEMMIDSLAEQLERAESKIDTLVKAIAKGGIKYEVLSGGEEEAEFLAKTAADAIASPMAEPTDELYDGNVGSAWDPKNPAKGPVKMPTVSEEYERQSEDFRERILKHS